MEKKTKKLFEKGHKGFKPKGAVSEKTKAWESLGDFITESGADRVKTILASCEPDDFIKYYTTLLEYFKPKLARSESKVESKIEGQLTLNVINPTDLDLINKL
jgi:hypothetical protein